MIDESSTVNNILAWDEVALFQKASKSFFDKVDNWGCLPFHPIRNTVIWAYGVNANIKEMMFSIKEMITASNNYKAAVPEGELPSHNDPKSSFFCKTAFVIIDSLKDKIALMVLSSLDDFNPEKHNPDFKQVVIKLKEIKDNVANIHRKWLAETLLLKLDAFSASGFDMAKGFRHRKIHMLEPRIEIYGKQSWHDWPYLIKVPSEKVDDILPKIEERMESLYPDKSFRERIIKGLFINGSLYDERRVEGRICSYRDAENNVVNCAKTILKTLADIYDVLTPFLDRYRELR
jgi:hypothetical protein